MLALLRPALVAAALISVHSVALACSCAGGADPADYDVIFVGTVRSQGMTGCGSGFTADRRTRFVVDEATKGAAVGDVIVVDHRVDGAACGVTYEAGETYEVWAVASDDGYVTSLCYPGTSEEE